MTSVEEYHPPYVLRFVGTILAAPRKEYSRDISKFLAAAPNTFARDNYISGLIFIVCIIGGFLFLWSFILVWMSFHGDYVGCAAGRPFEAAKNKGKKRREKQNSKHVTPDLKASTEPCPGGIVTTDDGGLPFENNSEVEEACSDMESNQTFDKPDSILKKSTSQKTLESFDAQRSKCALKQELMASSGSIDDTHVQAPLPSLRERRTQFCFFLFAFASLLCVPFILALSIKPLLVVSEVVDTIVEERAVRFGEVMGSLNQLGERTIKLTSLSQSVANETFTTICPLTDEVEEAYRLNLKNAYNLIAYQDHGNNNEWLSDLGEFISLFQSHDSLLEEIARYNDWTKSYAWLPPVLLFSNGFATLLLVAGVYLAWDRESSLRFQNLLSYAILPILVVCSLTCWVAVFGSAVVTSFAFDFCFSEGSPTQAIATFLQNKGYSYGSPIHDYTLNYALSCPWSDPTAPLDNEADRIQTIAELVGFTLSQADNIGWDDLTNTCGGSDGLTFDFLYLSSEIVSEMLTMQSTINDAKSSLACEDMSYAYDTLINDSFCDEGAAAFSWSFVFFVITGVSAMAMISMRASWRHKDIEDKIFEESEVAENMVVDEHEEYLTFISKYRQEWEEYQGVGNSNGPTQLVQGSTDTLDDSFSTISNNMNMTDSIATETLGDSTDISEIKSTFDPYNSDSQSNTGIDSDGSISFLSLKGSQEDVILPPLLNLGTDLDPEENSVDVYNPGSPELKEPKSMSIVDRTPPSLDDEI